MKAKRAKKKAVKRIKKSPVKRKSTGITGPWRIALIAGIVIAAAAVVHLSVNVLLPRIMNAELKWPEKLFNIKTGKDAIPKIHIKVAYDLFQKGKAVFIDARGAQEYEDAHIKGAISIPAGSPAEEIAKFKDQLKGRVLVTYCHGVGCHLSDKTAFALYDAGYRKIKIFFGGWNEWTAANYPLEKWEPPEQFKRLFEEEASADAIKAITLEEAKFIYDKNKGYIVDIGTRDQFNKTHIDKAMSVPYEDLDKTMNNYTAAFTQKPVIVYAHGPEKKAKEAALKIYKAGGKRVLLFPGMLKAWEKAGYPLYKAPPPQPPQPGGQPSSTSLSRPVAH
jgi:rhodanese-related sulfurtransferase